MAQDFVYVYDLPPRFNKDILDLPAKWHPEQYDIDQVRTAIERGYQLP